MQIDMKMARSHALSYLFFIHTNGEADPNTSIEDMYRAVMRVFTDPDKASQLLAQSIGLHALGMMEFFSAFPHRDLLARVYGDGMKEAIDELLRKISVKNEGED